MRRTLVSLITVILFAAALILSAVSRMHAQQGQQGQACTVATLNGSYGIISTGFQQNFATTAQNPGASVGTVSFDGAGHAIAKFTSSFNGSISPPASAPWSTAPQTANYTVAPDCTGTATVTSAGGGTASFVIVDQGKEVLVIQTNDGQVITAIVIKQ